MYTTARIASLFQAPILNSEITGFEPFRLLELEIESQPDFDLHKNLRLGHLVEKVISQCIRLHQIIMYFIKDYSLLKESRTYEKLILFRKNLRAGKSYIWNWLINSISTIH